MQTNDSRLRTLIDAIVAGDVAQCSRLMNEWPELAIAHFQEGATRHAAKKLFLPDIGRYIWAGDTPLHFAAAAYQTKVAQILIDAGAKVNAKNRHGAESLHAAATGQPGSLNWNPVEQTKMLELLVNAGADPNATDTRGVTPLHIAVRARCAAAVQSLLRQGADPTRTNKNGSTALKLAQFSTGRYGSGSEAARAQKQQILHMLQHKF